jgi:parallel beta-helix repeat protein
MNKTNLLLLIIILSAAFFCASTGVASAITLSDKYVGNTVVDLEWSKYGIDNFSKYELYRDDALIHTEHNRSTTFYRDEGLSKGVTYDYKIEVYNAAGELVSEGGTSATTGEVQGTLTQSTTWTAASSPYILYRGVTVRNGATLTIKSGVTVNYDDEHVPWSLEISGTIAPLDNVTFIGVGIELVGVDGCLIKNCVFDGATTHGDGITLYGCNNGIISNNVVEHYGCGICLDSSSNNKISGNTASSNGDGIRGDYLSNNNSISGNTASSNGDGIFLQGSNNMVTSNTANNNTYYDGICVGGSNNMVTSNTANNNSGTGIRLGGSNNSGTGNTASSNNWGGISLSGSNNTLMSNTANNNGDYGIGLRGSRTPPTTTPNMASTCINRATTHSRATPRTTTLTAASTWVMIRATTHS